MIATPSIKVFTSGNNPYPRKDEDGNVIEISAGEDLTNQFETWKSSIEKEGKTLQIKETHTNSNQYGWMLAVHYIATSAAWKDR